LSISPTDRLRRRRFFNLNDLRVRWNFDFVGNFDSDLF
jgi:hypothetical protein